MRIIGLVTSELQVQHVLLMQLPLMLLRINFAAEPLPDILQSTFLDNREQKALRTFATEKNRLVSARA